MRFNPARLRRARKRLGPGSLEQLAVYLSVGKSTVDRWERGEGEPTATQLAQLAKKTGRKVGYFLRGAA